MESECPSEKGHNWSFPLQVPDRVADPDALVEVVLRELLKLLILFKDGKPVEADSYMLLKEGTTPKSLDPSVFTTSEEISSLNLYEPRLPFIKVLLEQILGLVDLHYQGRPIKIDGFRLKDPRKWLVPLGGVRDILSQAATRCNLRCRFCYNKGSPPALRPRPRHPKEELLEILERVRLYVPGTRLGIFPTMGSPCEPLIHPYIWQMLDALRTRSQEVIRLSTNGSTLTKEFIRGLKKYSPICLDLSLNSSSPSRRRWLMRDPNPEVAIEAPKWLMEEEIPYSVVIVPWPFPSKEEMLHDLRETVSYAIRFSPAIIQISLPGFTRSFSHREMFAHEDIWSSIREEVHRLRHQVSVPMVLRPGLYEEYERPHEVNEPRISGLIPGSPAALSGLRCGDHILKVNGIKVKDRPQARMLLSFLHERGFQEANLTVRRGYFDISITVRPDNFEYPYTPQTACMFGIIFPSSGIPTSWLDRLADVVETWGAREVLLLSSRLVLPFIMDAISKHIRLSSRKIHIRVPNNGFFGGNIILGDLMVVEDFVDAIHSFCHQEGHRPELVAIPSSPFRLSGWRRDLNSVPYTEIERRTGIPVSLVECEAIFD